VSGDTDIKAPAILHLDADAFFASVEQAADPRLRGKPVAVGGARRGIVASASYEARRYGIYTPMPVAQARRLCPKLILLPGDFEKYERFSRWMFSYGYDFTPEIEVTSIDEGYMDLRGAVCPPLEAAGRLRQIIAQSLKITVSEGLGANKLVSQIASKLRKPAAFCAVPAGGEAEFLGPLSNRWLPGVGPALGARLDSAGLMRVGQIAATPLELLEALAGGQALMLQRFARGVDDRPVIPERQAAKSISQQETFEADVTDEEFVEATLRRMADTLMAQVRAEGRSIRTVGVKVRYNDMEEEQRSASLNEPTDLETDIYGLVSQLLRAAWSRRVSLRMVSLRLSNFYDGRFTGELPLETGAQQNAARRRLAEAVDALREKFGRGAILRGHDLRLREPAREPGSIMAAGGSKSAPSGRPFFKTSSAIACVPLVTRSYYSFLNSTLSPGGLVELAKHWEMPAVGLADIGNLHGAPEFVKRAEEAGIQPLLGAEVRVDGRPVWLYVENQRGYTNLCRLLSAGAVSETGGRTGGEMRHCKFGAAETAQASDGEAALQEMGPVGPVSFSFPGFSGLELGGLVAVSAYLKLAELFPGGFYYAATSPDELRRIRLPAGMPAAAVWPVHYAGKDERWKFDMLQAIRTRTLLGQAHPDKLVDEARPFYSPAELRAFWREQQHLLAAGVEIAERCRGFRFPFGPPQFPEFKPPDGSSSSEFLRRLALDGMRRRYPAGWEKVRPQLEEELAIIAEVGYEDYFLVVWDLLEECRRRGIDWLVRGSAADSIVCYCLGISNVCPLRFRLYFRRFLNRERMALNKLPDIDVDFPHDRKDDVIELLFAKYGPKHCAVVGGFSTFQARSAVADAAKALGVAEHQIRRFTERLPWGGARGLEERLAQLPDCRDLPWREEPYHRALQMAELLDGFPRHPKMHPCGVVLSRQPLAELTPVFRSNKGWPATHFDMDAVEAIGLVKMDILAQGGLAVIRDVGVRPPESPWNEPAVWELIAGGGARGVHHIESPAMISLCSQCNVRDIDTLVGIVSVIRPGAANEQKKRRFIRRRLGLEQVTYPHPSLEECLRDTFGLIVYEEHILQICEIFAGLPPGRADLLRRALGREDVKLLREIAGEFCAAARRRGHREDEIAGVWNQVVGFAGYAFCKAHAAAYAQEAYQAAWLKVHYPARFMAAVLTHGKGFYDPLVYVLECHRLGIPMLQPWVNEPGPAFVPIERPGNWAIRVPVTRIKGLSEVAKQRLLDERQRGEFESVRDFFRRVSPLPEDMELLIRAGALDGFGRPRTEQFWEGLFCLQAGDGPAQRLLWPPAGPTRLAEAPREEPSRRQRLQWESELLGFPVSGHPLELFDDVAWETYCPVARLGEFVGQKVLACGLVIEQRLFHQLNGEPMKFLTLADWTGIVETELFAPAYRRHGLATVRYPVLEVEATVEPHENGRGFSLRIHRAGPPRRRTDAASSQAASSQG